MSKSSIHATYRKSEIMGNDGNIGWAKTKANARHKIKSFKASDKRNGYFARFIIKKAKSGYYIYRYYR